MKRSIMDDPKPGRADLPVRPIFRLARTSAGRKTVHPPSVQKVPLRISFNVRYSAFDVPFQPSAPRWRLPIRVHSCHHISRQRTYIRGHPSCGGLGKPIRVVVLSSVSHLAKKIVKKITNSTCLSFWWRLGCLHQALSGSIGLCKRARILNLVSIRALKAT